MRGDPLRSDDERVAPAGAARLCGKPSVSTKPGFTVWTRMPRLRSWAAVARENASWACFDAEYGPEGGNATAPATETMLTTSDGRRRLQPGQERSQTPDAAEIVRLHHGLRRRRRERSTRPATPALFTSRWTLGVALEDAGGRALDRVSVGDVAQLVFAADLLGERSQPVFATREEHAAPAAAREQPGDLRADAGRRARDDGYPLHARAVSRTEAVRPFAPTAVATSTCLPCPSETVVRPDAGGRRA